MISEIRIYTPYRVDHPPYVVDAQHVYKNYAKIEIVLGDTPYDLEEIVRKALSYEKHKEAIWLIEGGK